MNAIARELARGVRRRRPLHAGIRIVTYHGVVEQRRDPRVEESFHTLAEFRAHIAILRRLPVVPLDHVVDLLDGGSRLPRIAITFDDGFRNNLIAVELLAEANLPATVFVTSECIGGPTIWPTLLRLVLARGSARRIRLGPDVFALDEDPAAFARVRASFKQKPNAQRLASWSELVEQLRPGELDALVAEFPSLTMMSWRDVATLHSLGVSIGSHGCTHELLHAAQPPEVRIRELAESRRQIEQHTGNACALFAFPNGTTHASSAEELRSCGYAAGFTMVSRAASPSDDRMLLPRLLPGMGPEKLAGQLVFGN